MRLILGDKVIADSTTDGLTRWMRADKPELNLQAQSREIVGAKYARNSSRGYGRYFSFTATVGRQFASELVHFFNVEFFQKRKKPHPLICPYFCPERERKA